jgi:hypothetical protein
MRRRWQTWGCKPQAWPAGKSETQSSLLDSKQAIIQVQRTKEIKTMMHIDFDTYELICDLLGAGDDLEPTYSVEEIAEMVGVTVEAVRYVDEAEYGAY